MKVLIEYNIFDKQRICLPNEFKLKFPNSYLFKYHPDTKYIFFFNKDILKNLTTEFKIVRVFFMDIDEYSYLVEMDNETIAYLMLHI